jgi:hypothetical protein
MSQCRTSLCRQIWPTVYFVPLVSIRTLNSLKFRTKRPRLFTQTDQAAWCSGHVPHFLGGSRFESLPGHRPPWLRFIMATGGLLPRLGHSCLRDTRFSQHYFGEFRFFFNSHRLIIVHPSSYHPSETSEQTCYLAQCNNVLCESLKTYKQHVRLPFLPTGLAHWRPTPFIHSPFTQCSSAAIGDANRLGREIFNAASRLIFTLAWTILMPYHTVRNVSNDRL